MQRKVSEKTELMLAAHDVDFYKKLPRTNAEEALKRGYPKVDKLGVLPYTFWTEEEKAGYKASVKRNKPEFNKDEFTAMLASLSTGKK